MRWLCSFGFHAWRFDSIRPCGNDFVDSWEYTRWCCRCRLVWKKRIFRFPRRVRT